MIGPGLMYDSGRLKFDEWRTYSITSTGLEFLTWDNQRTKFYYDKIKSIHSKYQFDTTIPYIKSKILCKIKIFYMEENLHIK